MRLIYVPITALVLIISLLVYLNLPNLQYSATKYKEQIIDSYLDGAHDVSVGDINLDGKLDIIADGYVSGSVIWYEQPSDLSKNWTKHLVDNLSNVHDTQVGDIDNDGTLDVISVSLSDNWQNYNQGSGTLVFYKNNLGSWDKVIIERSTQHWNYGILGSRSLDLYDMDNDNDLDIILAVDASTYSTRGALFWFENPGGINSLDNTKWKKYMISNQISNLADAQASDIDKDGNIDIVTSEHHPENNGTTNIWFGPSDPRNTSLWAEKTLSLNTSYHNYIIDFDNDTYLDILVAHWKHNKISWYKNPGNDIRNMSLWEENIIDSDNELIKGSMSIFAYDIDGDSDLDIGVNTIPGISINSNGYYIWYKKNNLEGTGFTRQVIDTNIQRTQWAHDMLIADIDNNSYGDLIGSAATADKITLYYDMLFREYPGGTGRTKYKFTRN